MEIHQEFLTTNMQQNLLKPTNDIITIIYNYELYNIHNLLIVFADGTA